jgi:CRISPR/Cas system CSM-associated protein Csm3 (group 7 of RAMP superfamily)
VEGRERAVDFTASVTLVFHSPLLVQGTGPGRGLADQVFFQRDGWPVVPGSSLKGAWRHALERLLRSLGEPVCCPPRPESMCPHVELEGRSPGSFCVACTIFGSPWLTSSVVVEDLHPVGEDLSPAGSSLEDSSFRASVAVDRVSGRASPRRLFLVEALRVREVRGRVLGRLNKHQLGLLLGAVPLISHLGSGNARGLGRVTVSVEDLVGRDGNPLPWTQAETVSEALGRVAR